MRIQKNKLAAIAGLVLAMAPAAQAATVNWTGAVDNNWSTVTGGAGFGNWDADPTIGGQLLALGTAGTSIVDLDTTSWNAQAVSVAGTHTLSLATGGVLTCSGYGNNWTGTVKFEGGTIGNPWATYAGPRLQGGTIEFHAGSFQAPRISGEDVYIDRWSSGTIHVVGKTAGSNFNPAYFRKTNKDNVSFQFSMVAGEGVDKIALSSTSSAFRNDSTGTGPVALTVDGIQAYLDGGGTQLVWELMTSAQASADATDDLTLVQTGLVDGGLGMVTATFDTVTLTIIPEPSADPEITSIVKSGDTVTVEFTGEASTTYVCKSSPGLSGFSNITITSGSLTTDVDGDATFTVAAADAKRFYLVAE
jgi:hypothetical protein